MNELSPKGEANERSLSRRVSRETSTPPPRNKPSSFYVYLAVLFGAAFVLLLLAYFVQRRNSETVQDNLRTTIASREELLDEIRVLEEENTALQKELDWQQTQAESLQQRFDHLNELHTQLQIDSRDQLVSWADFWAMSESFRAGDYEACANFYRSTSTPGYYTYATPESAQARYDEIYQFLTEEGYLEEGSPEGQGPEGDSGG